MLTVILAYLVLGLLLLVTVAIGYLTWQNWRDEQRAKQPPKRR